MNIAIFSLTRERLQYTQQSFASLRERAGHPYDHYVFDNGSQDGTLEWLEKEYKPSRLMMAEKNEGISVASNRCLVSIFGRGGYDIVAKLDNDCQVITPSILAAFENIYLSSQEAQRWVLGPRVEGIVNQPTRVRQHMLAGHEIGVTAIVGGIFHVVPAKIYKQFMETGGYDESLPKAWGQDDQFCEFLRANGYGKGYVESLVVNHIDGTDLQAVKYKDYHARKLVEMKERPVKA